MSDEGSGGKGRPKGGYLHAACSLARACTRCLSSSSFSAHSLSCCRISFVSLVIMCDKAALTMTQQHWNVSPQNKGVVSLHLCTPTCARASRIATRDETRSRRRRRRRPFGKISLVQESALSARLGPLSLPSPPRLLNCPEPKAAAGVSPEGDRIYTRSFCLEQQLDARSEESGQTLFRMRGVVARFDC